MAFLKNAGLTKLIDLTRTLIAKNARIVSESLNSLAARLTALENMENYGDLVADSISTNDFPRVMNDPIYVKGEGSPTIIPSFAGQRYLDITNNIEYYAKGNDSTSDWIRVTATSTYSSTGTAPVNGVAVAQAVSNATQKDSVPTKNSTNLVSSGTVYSQLQVLVQSVNALNDSIKELISQTNFGDLEAETIQLMDFPVIGEGKMVIEGSGAPTNVVLSSFRGQLYMDTTNNAGYIATTADSKTGWKKITP